ncbi:hypothetical protein L579_1829 [Pantoea sp. AS-PWVM4]|nr:hypothetical protein L579_1829 [Pantoea sp. AS-PWVM4]
MLSASFFSVKGEKSVPEVIALFAPGVNDSGGSSRDNQAFAVVLH